MELVQLLPFAAPFFAAFFGAASAFVFGATREYRQRRRRQLDQINVAIYGLVMTAETLLNLKRQFLIAFQPEFRNIQAMLVRMDPTADAATIAEIGNRVSRFFSQIAETDPAMNGAFKIWQEADFPLMPMPMDLAFTVAGSPELVRLLHVASSETKQVSRRIVARNEVWRNKEAVVLEGAPDGIPGVRILLFWYEMLDLRDVIRQHVDVALVVIIEALSELKRYRKQHFHRRKRIGQFLFGKTPWTDYVIPAHWQQYLPDRNDHRDVLNVRDQP